MVNKEERMPQSVRDIGLTLWLCICLLFGYWLMDRPVLGHSSDNTAPDCTIYPYIAVVVYDAYDQAGAADDFCVYPAAGWQYEDDSFSVNNECSICGHTDIGDHYQMGKHVSSMSLRNNSTMNATVWFYDGTDQHGTIPYCVYMPAGSHIHWNIGWPWNDQFWSLLLRTSTTGC